MNVIVARLLFATVVALAAMTVRAADIDALWDYADPELSEQRFSAALAGATPVEQAELRTQIARTHSLRRRFDDAHRELDAVEASAQAGVPVVAVRLRLERGRCFNSAGQREKARPLFEDAFTRAQAAGLDALAIDAAHMVAITFGGSVQALDWNDRALAMARVSADPAAKRWQLSLLNNSAWDLHAMGRYEEALQRFELALAEAQRRGRPQPVWIAEWSVARCLRSLKRYDEALTRQRALLAEQQRAGHRDGYVHEEIAENLLALGRGEEAREPFALAAELLGQDAGFARNHATRLARLRELGAAR